MTEVKEGVFYFTAPHQAVRSVSKEDIAFLKERATESSLKRARICLHEGLSDKLHDMLIVQERNTYIRPHRHLTKEESLHIVEGEALLLFFDNQGTMIAAKNIGDYASTSMFTVRIPSFTWHSLLIKTPFLVVHESTTGPFRKEDSEFALWSPAEGSFECQIYYQALRRQIESFEERDGQNDVYTL